VLSAGKRCSPVSLATHCGPRLSTVALASQSCYRVCISVVSQASHGPAKDRQLALGSQQPTPVLLLQPTLRPSSAHIQRWACCRGLSSPSATGDCKCPRCVDGGVPIPHAPYHRPATDPESGLSRPFGQQAARTMSGRSNSRDDHGHDDAKGDYGDHGHDGNEDYGDHGGSGGRGDEPARTATVAMHA
jgi:hypothetical protein